MLDLSVKTWKSYYKNKKLKEEWMRKPGTLETKTDGLKVTLCKTQDSWIVAYKNQVIYPEEFGYADFEHKHTSYGVSQFGLVWDHLNAVKDSWDKIPSGTEMFCELVARKSTLMSEYSEVGRLVLIGYTECSPVVKFGMLNARSGSMRTARNAEFAEILGLDLPVRLYEGLPGGLESWLESFLKIPSKYGGLDEGVIIKNGDGIFKYQQPYQLDKNERRLKKERLGEFNEGYWEEIQAAAHGLVRELKSVDVAEGLLEISEALKSYRLPVELNPARNIPTMLDDLQYWAKQLFLKTLPGNDGALVIGKFRVLTNGHVKMCEEAAQGRDSLVIGVVSSAETLPTLPLRIEALRARFPNAQILPLSTANLNTAIRKCRDLLVNINLVVCGGDRYEDYARMASGIFGLNVRGISRPDSEISATKVIENLADLAYFRIHTPNEVWKLYDPYLKTYA